MDLEFAIGQGCHAGARRGTGLAVRGPRGPQWRVIDPEAVKAVPEHIVKRYNLLPIKRDGNKLMVAIGDVKTSATGLGRRAPGFALPDHARSGDQERYRRSHRPRLQRRRGPSRTVPPASATAARPPTARPGAAGPSGGAGAHQGRRRSAPSPPTCIASNTPQVVNSGLANAIGMDISAIGGVADEDEDEIERIAEEAPIIRIAHAIVQQAIREKASDIHIEPGQRSVRIRYRIDGVLNETMTVPKHIQNPLISRFKIMADLNIAERRVPQDGRIPIRHEGKDYDLRVSCLPTMFGEKIVMRILDKSSVAARPEQTRLHRRKCRPSWKNWRRSRTACC